MSARKTMAGALRLVVALLLGAAALPSPALAADRPGGSAPAASKQEDWRAEFDAICAQTQDAMALSADELRRLVERSDALMPTVQRLPDPQRTVFAKRLKACRDLYVYVLESKGRS
jgi:hypothetical protein